MVEIVHGSEEKFASIPSEQAVHNSLNATYNAFSEAIEAKNFVVAEALQDDILLLEKKIADYLEEKTTVASQSKINHSIHPPSTVNEEKDENIEVKTKIKEYGVDKCGNEREISMEFQRRCGENMYQASIESMDQTLNSPIHKLWPKMSETLKAAFYGSFLTHGIVSTRKAVAAIRGIDDEVRNFINKLDEIAPGAPTVPSSQDSQAKLAPIAAPKFFKSSSCVQSTAISFLEKEDLYLQNQKIGTKSFFIQLVKLSTGEFMQWWRSSGISESTLVAHLFCLATDAEMVGKDFKSQNDNSEIQC